MFSSIRRMFGGVKESAVSHIRPYFMGRAVFPSRNYQNFAKEAYQLNVIAYRCIALISQSAASVPWLVYVDDKEMTDHPLLKLLRRPNPLQSGKELFTSLYAHDLLIGDSYLERVLVGGGDPKEMYVLRPDRMKILPGKFAIPAAFEYQLGSGKHQFPVDPITGTSDIMHVRRFNPLDDWYGQSPLEAAGMSVDSHNEATRWNYAVLKNGARPSGALEYGTGEMDEENFDRLKGEIETSYSGSQRGRPMLLQGGLKWVQMMLSQMEMDWATGKETSAREIAIAYSVPEQLVGVPGQQTFNNYREARLAMYEDAVLPLLDRFSESLTNWFNQMPQYVGVRVGYDEDQIPALALRREQQWDRVNGAQFLTLDEKREALGYSAYEPDESNPASIVFVSGAAIPLSMAAATFNELTETENPGLDGLAVGNDTTARSSNGVQGLALNGAQIAAALQLVQSVADGLLPPETAVSLMLVAFPTVDEATVRAMVAPAIGFKPAKEDVDEEGKPIPPDPEKMKRRWLPYVIKALKDLRGNDRQLMDTKAYELAYGKFAHKFRGKEAPGLGVGSIHVNAPITLHTPDINIDSPIHISPSEVKVHIEPPSITVQPANIEMKDGQPVHVEIMMPQQGEAPKPWPTETVVVETDDKGRAIKMQTRPVK